MPEHDRGSEPVERPPEEGPRTPLQDITAAWRETSVALHDTERRYRELVEYSLGLICTHDLSGTILSVNPAAANSLGYHPAEGIGRNLREFLAPDRRHEFDAYLERIEQNGHDAGLMQLVARNGTVRVWMYRNVLTHGPHASYVLGHALDITERVSAERGLRESERALRAARAELELRVLERTRALEQANQRLRVEIAEREEAERSREHARQEAQEANRLKDEFLGTLSHELRTPLNAIYGWARILRMRELDASTAHAVAVIERNAEAQVRLIDEVLDVSRIIAGKMTLETEEVDVSRIVRATIETLRPAIQAKGIVLEERIEDEAGLVFADPHRLQQVCWNLLSNALKFTASGGTITVVLHRAQALIEFEITDTGVGIRQDVLPFVFDRFRQGDSSMTRQYGGLGLGLAIVKHIVEHHGGSVRADSAGEGHGATFTVQLPAADRGQPRATDATVTRDAGASSILRGRTVLVVEDDEDAREITCETLRAAGARVVPASLSREAAELARNERPDVLVADLGLPGEDGFALLIRVREMYPDLPAVAVTAYARAIDRERALAAGFQEYVVKPVDPLRLVGIIASIQ